MAGSSDGYHEPVGEWNAATRDDHRAIAALREEPEAVNQRVDACQDPGLRKILIHNSDEEKKQAVMTLEWIRRQDKTMDAHLREFPFAEGDIAH